MTLRALVVAVLSTVALAIAVLCAACSSENSTPADAGPVVPDAEIPAALPPFPAGFQWGTAIAPYQVEGGLHADDWYPFETSCPDCSMEHADDGPDFWDNYQADLDAAAALGTNAIRLGIEWARIFPTEASFPDHPDAAAVAHYHDILTYARSRGMQPMVTLFHFATPLWLSDPANFAARPGWEDPGIVDAFATWAGWAAREYGGDVDLWITINEPIAFIGGGWLGEVFPPGKLGDSVGGMKAAYNMIHAHARAYDAIVANDTVDADGDGSAARVSIATHNRVYLPYDPTSTDDVRATRILDEVSNRMFLDALVDGNLDLDFDGSFDGPDDVRGDATLKGRLDFIGLNYYGVTLVEYVGETTFPFVGLNFQNDLDRFGVPGAISDFGASVYPQGFQVVLDELVPYHLPIIVTENGIADAADGQRPRFILEHLYALERAIANGADVRGYYHWSLMDNFEWAAGFCPEFGLYRVDRTVASRPLTAGAGAHVYQQIISANAVPVALFGVYPSYARSANHCARTGF